MTAITFAAYVHRFAPRFFNMVDIVFSFIALSNFSMAFINPSPLNAAILQIRLIPLRDDRMMAINIWLIPNLVALCHTVGNDELMDFTMFRRFIYFATVLSPEYFVMLLPGNIA